MYTPSLTSVNLHRRSPTMHTEGGDSERTQRVTAADLRAGRVRLPAGAKRLLPDERSDVQIVLRNRRMAVRYDPRNGPDQVRSGVLGIGRRTLAELVDGDEVLRLTHGTDGVIRVD